MRRFVGPLVVLGFGVAAAGQAPAPLVPGNAAILGRIVEAGSTTGVPDAMVTLSGAALGPAAGMFTNGMPAGPRRIVADGQGRFLFRDLPAGSYNITAHAPGFADGVYGEARTITIRRSLDLIRSLTLTDADKVVNVTIQLWKRGGIGGTVLDEAGEPVVGAPITILARMTDWGGPVMQQAATATTDDRGMYHADVTPGDYLVALLAATTTVPATAVDEFQRAVAEGGQAQQAYLNGVFASGGLLPRGMGVRAGNLVVSQMGNSNAFVVPPFVTEGGRLSFYPTTFHPSSPTAMSASLVSVASGEEKTGVDIRLKPVPVRRVSGRVTGPSGPMANVALRLVAPDPAVRRTSPATLIDTPSAMADVNGDFTFLGVAPGSYTLLVMRPPPTPSDPVLWSADTISIGDADVLDLQVALQTGVRISGRIVIDGASQLPPAALRAIAVAPRPVSGSTGAMYTPTSERADEAGRFTTRQVVPGPYMMVVTGVPAGWILKSVTSAGQNVVDVQFNVTTAINDVVVTITDRISTLTGTARDAEGRPSSTATVAVFPTDKTLWRLPGMASRRVQTAAPGRDGRYGVRGLPSGEYFVVAADWPSADFSDGRVLTALMPTASRITIADGETRTQDLRVAVIR